MVDCRLSQAVISQLLTVAAIIVKGAWLDADAPRFATLLNELISVYASATDNARVRTSRLCRNRAEQNAPAR